MSKGKVNPANPVKSVDDFRKAHDQSFIVPERFREGIKGMGPNGWMYLGDFMRQYKINPQQGALYRKDFDGFILEADKKMIICGSTKLAKKLRDVPK